jgi:uncharacterized membrane protein YhaH (DUF805 family)
MNYYIRAFKKYADFEGRDNRPQYWYFYLVNLIVYIVLGFINTAILASLYALVVLIPSIAIGIRRLHDIGKSGWWLLISLIPIVGWIWIIVLLATKGEDKPNKYGSVPKGDDFAEVKEEVKVEEKEEINQANQE